MEVQVWEQGTPEYPGAWTHCLGEEAPAALYTLGDPACLQPAMVALFCSSRCPGRLLNSTYALCQQLRREGRTVISGFHAPMEQEAMKLLLKSPHALVGCIARGLASLRIRPDWKRPLEEGRLLLLSPFPASVRRVSEATARLRNRCAAALAERVVIPHATPDGQLHALAREAVHWEKPLYTVPDAANQHVLQLGALPLDP